MDVFILFVILFVAAWAFVTGGFKTFQRNWLVALLLMLFAFPAWAVWAFIEVFTGPVTPWPLPVHVTDNRNIDDL